MKKTATVFFIALSFFTISVTPIVSFAWGDSNGGRPSYSLQDVNEGKLGDKIVFNSITIKDTDYAWYKNTYGKDLPAGIVTHEKNYVGAREDTGVNAGTNNVWQGNDIQVEDGKTYVVRLYVHNNNPNGDKAIARNTKVYFNIPTESARQVKVNGYIHADNADPTDYVDYINFNSDHAFHLEYVYGSALLENNGKAGGSTLSNNIVEPSTGGVLIGYDALDGNVPGCYQYDNYITIRMKAVFDYNYTIEAKVRHMGEDGWGKVIETKVNDKVEIEIKYHNLDEYTQDNIVVRTSLHKNLQYIPGSAKLFNDNFPDGISIEDSAIDGLVDIGSYAGNSKAFLRFTAKVIGDGLDEGINTLTSYGQVEVGTKTTQDYVNIAIYKDTKYEQIRVLLIAIDFICLIFIILLTWRKYRQKNNI